jgi:hypothetical protein
MKRRVFITLLGGAVQGGSHEFESSYAPRPPRVAAELRHDARRRSRHARRAGAGTGARDIRRATD